MYNPFDGAELFEKHRDGCGDISNHVIIADVEVTEEIQEEGSDEPILYICTVYMTWLDGDGTIYEYPECELEDPDDYDEAQRFVIDQIV